MSIKFQLQNKIFNEDKNRLVTNSKFEYTKKFTYTYLKEEHPKYKGTVTLKVKGEIRYLAPEQTNKQKF